MDRKMMVRNLLPLLLTGMVFVALISPSFGQSKDPLIGTWILDRGQSTFDPDNPPQKRILIFSTKDSGSIHCVIQTTSSGGLDNGLVTQSEFSAKYDGKDYEISESLLDTVSLKKIDANTVERIGKIHGMPVETATLKISQDGKLLTIATKGEFKGNAYSSSQVFAKK